MANHSITRNHGMTPMNVTPRLGRLARAAAWGVLVALSATACDLNELLEVDPVDRIPAEGLTVPANAELLVNGAIGDFECAYGGYVLLSGIVSDELTDATQTAARWPADRRDFRSGNQAQFGTWACTDPGAYVPLSTARWSADNILTALQSWTDTELADLGFDRQELIAKAAAYAGYSYLLLGEAFCSMAIDEGPEMQPSAVFQLAVDRFTTALAAAQAAGTTDLANMSRVGRARAYLSLGDDAAALADAQAVPSGFEYVASTASEPDRRENRVFEFSGPDPLGGDLVSIEDPYLDYLHFGEADPRIMVSDSVQTNNDGTTIYHQLKYGSLADPIPLATYDEARLIIAEIQGGQTAVDIINDFHDAAGLGTFSSADPTEIMNHLIEERRVELWLEGHRFNDIERFNLALDPAAGTPYRKGGDYLDARCFPLPDIEIRNNPNI